MRKMVTAKTLYAHVRLHVRTLAVLFLVLVSSVTVTIFLVENWDAIHYKNDKVSLTPREVEDIAETEANICGEVTSSKRQDCYEARLALITKKYGLANGEVVLSAIQDIDSTTRSCHVLGHYMAREAYTRNPGDFYGLIDSLNVNACGSGFLHGALGAYSEDHPEVKIDGAFADQICGRGKDDYSRRTCVHFMGHMLLLRAYADTGEESVDQALTSCQSLRKDWLFNCYDGIFMEIHQRLTLFDHGLSKLPDQTNEYLVSLEKRCNSYSDFLMGKACWLEMAEMYAHVFRYNPKIIHDRCSAAPKKEYSDICNQKGGTVLATYFNYDTPEKLTVICSFYRGDDTAYNFCTDNVLSSLMYTSPKFIYRGLTLCSSIDQKYQSRCYMTLAGKLRNLTKDEKQVAELCPLLPEKYRYICKF